MTGQIVAPGKGFGFYGCQDLFIDGRWTESHPRASLAQNAFTAEDPLAGSLHSLHLRSAPNFSIYHLQTLTVISRIICPALCRDIEDGDTGFPSLVDYKID